MTIDAELAPLPDTGYVYKTSWRLGTPDMDEEYRLRVDGVARYIQEVGAEHLDDADATDDQPHWIVQRTVIDVHEPIVWPDVITFRRWCAGLSTRWCAMRVQLEGANGGRIETEAFWINMNKETGGPARLTDRFMAMMATTTDEHRLRWKPWLTEPATDEATLDFPLRRTDVDHFRHVNNTVYWHGVHEVLADSAAIIDGPYRAIVEYKKPITLGEDVRIHTLTSDDAVDLWFVVAGEVRAAARLTPR
ncbi:acyl-[acyl-carrier-protein] thioesterase [Antrihabitans spumae]|uniref:Acyl-[acyl-carrier-protein] thioesterase n=1 Tax=Antrihabitans spumae TaxID=3373370 RepID=A0ABW7JI83_9NOCA